MIWTIFATIILALICGACTKKEAVEKAAAGSEPVVHGTLFNSREGGFSLEVPTNFPPPKITEPPTPTELPIHMWASALSDTAVIMFACTDFPDSEFVAAQSDTGVITRMRDTGFKNINAKADSEKVVSLAGHPGREIWFTGGFAGQKVHGRTAFYVARPRVYQVEYFTLGNPASVTSPEIRNLFRSFTITKQ